MEYILGALDGDLSSLRDLTGLRDVVSLSLWLMLLPTFCFTQVPDTSKANQLLENAILQIDAANYDSSTILTDQAYQIFKKNPQENQAKIADCLNNFGRNCFNQDDPAVAIIYHLEALAIRQALFGKKDLKVASSYNNLGNAFIREGRYNEALRVHQEALAIRTLFKEEAPLDLAISANNMGSVFYRMGDLRSAYIYFSKALTIREKELGPDNPKTARTRMSIGSCFLSNESYEEALVYFQESLVGFRENRETNHPDIADAFYNLGNTYFGLQNYREALANYQNALSIRSAIFGKESLKSADVHQNIANCYAETSVDGLAEIHYSLAKSIRVEKLPANHPDLLDCIEATALLNHKKGAYKKAILGHQQIMSARKKIYGADSPYLGMAYGNLGNSFLGMNQLDSALFYYKKGNPIFEKYAHKNADNLNNQGICYRALKQLETAISYFKKALQIPNITLEASANYHKNLGITFAQKGDFENGILEFNKGLSLLDFDNQQPFANLEVTPLVVEILGNRASTNFQLFEQKKKKENLDKAFQDYELALELMEELRLSFTENQSKQQLQATNHAIFEGAIQTCFALATVTDSSEYLEKAFYISEKSKNLILLESLKNTYAKKIGGIPDSILQAENLLQIKLANTQKKRLEKKEMGDQEGLVQLDRSLFQLKERQRNFIANLEQQYPKYYQTKYESTHLEIPFIQSEIIAPDQSLVEFFIGDSTIYLFHLNTQNFEAIKIKKDFPLTHWVWQIRKSIFYFPTAPKSERIEWNKAYLSIGQALYAQLFDSLSSLKNRLVLIPDGVLNYLPFDALITAPPKNEHRFKGYPFLIKKHEISYAYSCGLLHEMQQNRFDRSEKYFAGFAPIFSENDPLLKPLKNNSLEVQAVEKRLGGDLFLGENATLQNFKKEAINYQLLLLATHGKANAQDGNYSFLAFSNSRSDEDNLLYVNDLYAMNLPAELIVLSACETGVGSFDAGEGVVSLARGFSYAGTKSLVTSLWAVNDKSTAELIPNYFKYLHAGWTKDKALQQAKLDYIQNSDNPHPFYWAAFIGVGDMGVIQPSGDPIYLYFGISGFLLIILLVFFFIKKS